jgi:LPXTG-motif cell wall-anchored protein
MPSTKRLRALLTLMFGVIMTAVAFAGPANAEGAYPPEVLGTGATASTPAPTVAGVSANELAFTGTNGIRVGAIGGLLLVGGTALVFTSRRRKING